MEYLNLYKSRYRIPQGVKGYYIKFMKLYNKKSSERRAFLQSIVSKLNKKGFDGAVAPNDIFDEFDIIFLGVLRKRFLDEVLKYYDLSPRIEEGVVERADIIERAWQNRVRTDLKRKGFLKVGNRYVLEKDVNDTTTIFKRAYKIQIVLIDNFPSLFIDPRTKIMIPIEEKIIDSSDSLGEASPIAVRVLPNWQRGILVGRVGKEAMDMEFPFGHRMYKTPDYWRVKYGLYLVKPNDEMLNIYIPEYEKTLPYPKSCVFSEFKNGMSFPEKLKKSPQERVLETKEFVNRYLRTINFLEQTLILNGPTPVAYIGYTKYIFPSSKEFEVIVGGGEETTVRSLNKALRQYGPYAGKIDGKYIVIHHGEKRKILNALKSVENAYSNLNLGKLELYTSIGDDGFIETNGESVIDYTSTIADLHLQLNSLSKKLIAIIVLPYDTVSDIYYKAKKNLFERTFQLNPIPTQAVKIRTINDIVEKGRGSYPICANIASQCYVKLGGTGSAVWILKNAADSIIPGISPGSTCYAYHDVSRRPEKKASATAYSAITDSYGRYIATGSKPVGGEKLTPSVFYDILLEILEKISIFNRRYSMAMRGKRFQFRRLVFAKDGVIRSDEADMMEEVIFNGIPDERKEAIPDILRRKSIYPKSLVIDVIDINKNPSKRVFERRQDIFYNVNEGMAIAYDDFSGLLVTCGTNVGTVQPLEISIKKHMCLNMKGIPRPHISKILEEYYRLTFLNWASLFRQGKYALPQILTQNLGKNLSAGVLVPDNTILL